MRLGLFRLDLLMIAALVSSASAAQAETRLAYSQRLGLEVLAAGPDWCAPVANLRVVGQNRQTFAQPELAGLMQRVAGGIVAAQCPAAIGVTFAGSLPDSATIVWRGRAEAADSWALHVLDPATASTPPQTDPSTAAAAPAASSPLIGNWVGVVGCGPADQAAVTISASDVAGSVAHGVVQLGASRFHAQAGPLRYGVEGNFDAASGQFMLRPGAVIRANGDSTRPFAGTIDAAANVMTVEGACYGNPPPQTLSRASATPVLADRVIQDRIRREKLIAEAVSGAKPAGRLVGTMPHGTPRQPSCPELLAWATAFPLDLRVRLQSTTDGVLRQFDDENSAKVFGVPAYDWIQFGENGRWSLNINPRDIGAQTCRGQERDPRYRVLMQVLGDQVSFSALAIRRQIDDAVDMLPAKVATTGGTAAEMYADLAPLTQPATLGAAFQNLTQLNPQALTASNQSQLIASAEHLREALASRAEAEARTEIAAAPNTADGLAAVDRSLQDFRASFPADGSAMAAVGATKRHAIEAALEQEAVEQVDRAPRTLAGLEAAEQAKAALPHPLPDGGGAIDTALQHFRQQALPAILTTETATLADVPATRDGAVALADRRARVAAALGSDPAEPYLRAVDARLTAIARAQVPTLQAELAGLDDSWPSVAAARAQGQAAAKPFGASPAAQPLLQEGDAKAAAIEGALADKAVADLHAMPGQSILQIAGILNGGAAAAAPFDRDPAGKTFADRIRQEAARRAGERADDGLPSYRASLSQAPATHAMARKLALAWVILDRSLQPKVPEFGHYAELTRAAALKAESTACDRAIRDLGLSSSDAKLPMVLGNRVATLGDFACAMRDTGVTNGKLVAPSSSGGDYTLKLFKPADGGLLLPSPSMPDFGPGANPFEFTGPPSRPAETAGDAIDDVHVVVLRMVDIGVDRRALVGVQIGDEAKLTPLSVPEWRQNSGSIIAAGRPMVSAAECAEFAEHPERLAPQTAADALLACPHKP